MIRIRSAWRTLLLPVAMLLIAGLSQAAEPKALANRILDISGFRKQVEQIPALLKQQLRSLDADKTTPNETKAVVIRFLTEAFKPGPLNQSTVEIFLQQDATVERMEKLLTFLNTPLAKKFTALEVAAGTPEGQAAMRTYRGKMNENPPAKRRVALIQELEVAALSSTLGVEMTVAMVEALVRGLSAARPANQQILEEQLLQITSKLRKRLAPRMLRVVLISMHYTYQTVTTRELEQYIAFHNSELGQWYVKALAGSLLGALSDSMEKAAAGIRSTVTKA